MEYLSGIMVRSVMLVGAACSGELPAMVSIDLQNTSLQRTPQAAPLKLNVVERRNVERRNVMLATVVAILGTS